MASSKYTLHNSSSESTLHNSEADQTKDRGLYHYFSNKRSPPILVKEEKEDTDAFFPKRKRARYGTWTHGPQIKSLMLYRLS